MNSILNNEVAEAYSYFINNSLFKWQLYFSDDYNRKYHSKYFYAKNSSWLRLTVDTEYSDLRIDACLPSKISIELFISELLKHDPNFIYLLNYLKYIDLK